MNASELQENLRILGELLESRELGYQILAIGGGALLLRGLMKRPTADIDIVAFGDAGRFVVAHELPAELLHAVADVASLRRVPENWLNSAPADLFRLGMPPGYEARLDVAKFGALTVYSVGRYDQICFKLQAWVDRYPGGEKHLADLRLLEPTNDELITAAKWSRTHDPSEGFLMGVLGALRLLGVENPGDI